MAWTDIAHTVYQWFNSPSTSTPLDAPHLIASEQDLWNATQADIDALDAYLEPLITAATPASNIIAAGNIGSSYTPSLGSFLNTWITFTLTSATGTITLTGLSPGSQVVLLGNQDATGGRTLSISNGTTSQSVAIPTAPGAPFRVLVYTPDGTNMFIQPPNPTEALITATNAAWPIPAGATQLEVTCVGGGAGGGGGGSAGGASPVATQVGGSGGGPGLWTTEVVAVGANTTLNVTVGAGGSGGGGGVAGTGTTGAAGADANYGVDTTVTGTGISITAQGGAKGKGGALNSVATTAVTVWGGKNSGATTSTVGAATGGTASSASGASGGAPIGPSGGPGGGGAPASATNGGNGGTAGTATAAGGSVSGTTGTTSGATGASAAANTGAGAGGGGGGSYNSGTGPGTGGTGGAGGSGLVIVRVVG